MRSGSYSHSLDRLVSNADLKLEFERLSFLAIEENLRAEAAMDETTRLSAFLRSQITIRSLDVKEGSDVDAILSRIGRNLDAKNYVAALLEVQALPKAAAQPLEFWVQNLRPHAVLQQALKDLELQYQKG